MQIFIFFFFQCIWKSNEKNIKKKNYLLNNNYQNNSLLYKNHMNNSTNIKEDQDYLINNSDYYNFSQFSETSKYIFFQIKLCENENISYNFTYENESNKYIKNNNYSKGYLYKIEEINYEDLPLKQIYFPENKNKLLFRYHYLNTNKTPVLINNFEYDIKIVNKYIYVEFFPLIYNEIIDYIILYSKNKSIENECYLYNIIEKEIPEDIEIYYYSFLTDNNNLIVKLDVTIFENSTYFMNIIATEKNNHKIKIAYGLKEFQYILKSYIIDNQLYFFEEEKIIFKTPPKGENKKYLIQWNDSTNEEIIRIYSNDKKIDELNNTNKIHYLFVPKNQLYHIIYQSQSKEKEIYFDIFDEYGKFFDDENEYSIIIHNNTEISFYTNISKYERNQSIIFCVYLENIKNFSNYNYVLFNKTDSNNKNETKIPDLIYENNETNLFYIIIKKEQFNNVQINFKIEGIDKLNFKQNKTVYIRYLKYKKIDKEYITQKNMLIPTFYIINRTELSNKTLIFYTKYIDIFEIYYGDYIIENKINKNKKQQNIQVFDYSNNKSENIIIIKAFNKENLEKSFQIINSFTKSNLSYIISEKRESFIKNYKCEKHLLILNIYNQKSNDKLIFIKKKNNNNLEFHLTNNFNNFQTLENVYKSNETIINNIKKLENMIDLIYVNCENNGEFTLYQLNTNDSLINNLESSSFTYFYLENKINLNFSENLINEEINLEFNLVYDNNSNVSIFLNNNEEFILNNKSQKTNFSFIYTNKTNLTILNHKKNQYEGSLLNVIIGLNQKIIKIEMNTTYNKEIKDKIILIYNPNDTITKEIRLSIKTKNVSEICLNQDEGKFPFLYFLKENCEILYSNSSKYIIMENLEKKGNVKYISILTSNKIYLNYTYVKNGSGEKENITKINYDGITQFKLENKKNYLFYQITPCNSHKQEVKINSNEYILSNKTNFNFIYNIEENKTNEFEFLNGSCLFHYLKNITTIPNIKYRNNLKLKINTNTSSKTFNIEFEEYNDFLDEYYIIMTNNISLFNINNPCFLYEVINNISKSENISIDKRYSKDNNIHFVDTKFFNLTIYITVVGKKINIPDILVYYDVESIIFNYSPLPSESWFYGAIFMTIIAIILLIIFIHINDKRSNEKENESEEIGKSVKLYSLDNME